MRLHEQTSFYLWNSEQHFMLLIYFYFGWKVWFLASIVSDKATFVQLVHSLACVEFSTTSWVDVSSRNEIATICTKFYPAVFW